MPKIEHKWQAWASGPEWEGWEFRALEYNAVYRVIYREDEAIIRFRIHQSGELHLLTELGSGGVNINFPTPQIALKSANHIESLLTHPPTKDPKDPIGQYGTSSSTPYKTAEELFAIHEQEENSMLHSWFGTQDHLSSGIIAEVKQGWIARAKQARLREYELDQALAIHKRNLDEYRAASVLNRVHNEHMTRYAAQVQSQGEQIMDLRREVQTVTTHADESSERARAALSALAELVRLKDLHDNIEWYEKEMPDEPDLAAKSKEYKKCKPEAWRAARELVDASGPTVDGLSEPIRSAQEPTKAHEGTLTADAAKAIMERLDEGLKRIDETREIIRKFSQNPPDNKTKKLNALSLTTEQLNGLKFDMLVAKREAPTKLLGRIVRFERGRIGSVERLYAIISFKGGDLIGPVSVNVNELVEYKESPQSSTTPTIRDGACG